MRYAIVAVLCLLVAAPALADTCDILVACSVQPTGGNEYEITWTVTNLNDESNALFFLMVDNPSIPAEWETIEWIIPTGWVASHPGQQVHIMSTNNSDGNSDRIYSSGDVVGGPVALGCGPGSGVFTWRLKNKGGPVPDCELGLFTYTLHMQKVDPTTCNNIGPSFTCPGTVPVEETSWGQIKALYN